MQIIKKIFDDKLKTYTCALSFNSIYQKKLNPDNNKYKIEGFITTFDNIDYHYHIIKAEAANHMLKYIDYEDIKILYNHDEKYGPIGKLTKAEIKTKIIKGKKITGIYAYIELYNDLPNSKYVINLLKKRLLNKFSIGFKMIESEVVNFNSDKHKVSNSIELQKIPQNRITEIYKIDLVEISIVAFPANNQASILEYNQDNSLDDLNSSKNINNELYDNLEDKTQTQNQNKEKNTNNKQNENKTKTNQNQKKLNSTNLNKTLNFNTKNNLINSNSNMNSESNSNIDSTLIDKKEVFRKLNKIKINIKKLLETKLKKY
ncbi:MAG: HK97 family phage prohead protease [Rickettsiales bacterium]